MSGKKQNKSAKPSMSHTNPDSSQYHQMENVRIPISITNPMQIDKFVDS